MLKIIITIINNNGYISILPISPSGCSSALISPEVECSFSGKNC